jgi:hypothetical protein
MVKIMTSFTLSTPSYRSLSLLVTLSTPSYRPKLNLASLLQKKHLQAQINVLLGNVSRWVLMNLILVLSILWYFSINLVRIIDMTYQLK